jgi:Flp pilus assembly protein TadG
MKPNPSWLDRRRQRGVVAIIFGLMLVVLVAFAGLAIDLGRFFVIKSELQNAVDACALAAASQLRPGLNDSEALKRAVAYGRVFSTGGLSAIEAIKNRANFQSEAVAIADTDISFAASLAGAYETESAAIPNTATYAKCDYPLNNLPLYFMQVLNLIGLGPFTTQTVSAMAVATVGPLSCNIVPVGICGRSNDAPTYGLNVGDWLTVGSEATQIRGWFHWIQFPDQANGAIGVRDRLKDHGSCVIPTSASLPSSGNMNVAEWAWNSRFGIYKEDGPTTLPPDKTGYSYFNHTVPGSGTPGVPYSWANWPTAGIGTGTAVAYPDYRSTAIANNLNYWDSFPASPSSKAEPKLLQPVNQDVATRNELRDLGQSDRRVVIVPMMNCSESSVGQMVKQDGSPVLACALMLNPFGQVGGTKINGKLEYLGLLGSGNSPCGNGNVAVQNMSVLVK